MAVKVLLLDGRGGGNLANFDELGAMLISNRPEPPTVTIDPKTTFRQFLTNDGLATGSADMRVDGSVTSQEFFVSATADSDRYIMSLSFLISDAGAVLNEFGNIGALVNGCRLFYDATEGIVDIADDLISNGAFVRLCQGNPAFGDGMNAFRASNVVGLSEGYVPVLNFRMIFGYEWGIVLKGNTNQRLVLEVNDDVTTVDGFDCIAYGFDRKRES